MFFLVVLVTSRCPNSIQPVFMRISTGTTGENKSNCPFRRRTKRQAIMGNEVFRECLWYGTLQNTTETSHSLSINISKSTSTQAHNTHSYTPILVDIEERHYSKFQRCSC